MGIADRLVNADGGAAGAQAVAEARAVAPGLVAEGAGWREVVADLVQDEAAVAALGRAAERGDVGGQDVEAAEDLRVLGALRSREALDERDRAAGLEHGALDLVE